MQEYYVNNLNNFIGGFYIDTKLCDEIVAKGEQDTSVFFSGTKEYRSKDLKDFDFEMFNRYSNELHLALEKYKKLYTKCYENLHMWSLTLPRIQRYDPGKFYSDLHCENDGQKIYQNRHLAYMTYLNDIDEGGGTEFIHQGIITKAEKGLTLFWPAGWTHYHVGVVAPNDVKYILTGWGIFHT